MRICADCVRSGFFRFARVKNSCSENTRSPLVLRLCRFAFSRRLPVSFFPFGIAAFGANKFGGVEELPRKPCYARRIIFCAPARCGRKSGGVCANRAFAARVKFGISHAFSRSAYGEQAHYSAPRGLGAKKNLRIECASAALRFELSMRAAFQTRRSHRCISAFWIA